MAKVCDGGRSYGGPNCVPGCNVRMYPKCNAYTWDCSFPPGNLRAALETQLAKKAVGNSGTGWNEVVIDTRSIEAHLPRIVTAFFHRGGVGQTRDVRARFLKYYGLDERTGPPLVGVNVGSAGNVFYLSS